MFNSYWNTSAYFGYTPLSPFAGQSSQAYPGIIGGGGNCYNPYLRQNYKYVCQPTTPEIKTSIEDLRNYVISLEANRRLEDLNDVDFPRTPEPGDVLYRDGTTNQWQLTNYLSGGEW